MAKKKTSTRAKKSTKEAAKKRTQKRTPKAKEERERELVPPTAKERKAAQEVMDRQAAALRTIAELAEVYLEEPTDKPKEVKVRADFDVLRVTELFRDIGDRKRRWMKAGLEQDDAFRGTMKEVDWPPVAKLLTDAVTILECGGSVAAVGHRAGDTADKSAYYRRMALVKWGMKVHHVWTAQVHSHKESGTPTMLARSYWMKMHLQWGEAAMSTAAPAEPSEPPKAEDEADEADNIRELEAATPALDRHSGEWVTSRKAAGLEGLETGTLNKYRKEGLKTADSTLGRDRDGRVWRKPQETIGAWPRYLLKTLTSQHKKT